MVTLHGIAASPGIAIGKAMLLDRRQLHIPKRHIASYEIEAEVRRFDEALQQTDLQLELLLQRADDSDSTLPGLVEAYRLIAKDEHLLLPTYERIQKENLNAEWALQKTLEDIDREFERVGIEYLQDRRSDVGFVCEQILQHLLGHHPTRPLFDDTDVIVVAYELSPTELLYMNHQSLRGLVLATGGRTSHTVILARARSLPVVVGLSEQIEQIGSRDALIVDGNNGTVWMNPALADVQHAEEQQAQQHARLQVQYQEKDIPAESLDGRTMLLAANVELNEEIPQTLQYGARAIGLYRTEFLFLDRAEVPTEEEHFFHACQALKGMQGRPVTFRTMDLGTDKLPPFLRHVLPSQSEPNPALGLRSLRLCLKEKKMFKAQLRGLLRASALGPVQLLFPMVAGVSDFRLAKALLMECQEELSAQGLPYQPQIPVGIMIEMPSAVITADQLAEEVDFFSIGTNDLLQYTLALDRGNESLEFLYQPLHPALLRMIYHTVEAAHQAGIPVSLCGEMAGNPTLTRLMMGLELDELSMLTHSLPNVRRIVRASSQQDAALLAQRILSMRESKEIERCVEEDFLPFRATLI